MPQKGTGTDGGEGPISEGYLKLNPNTVFLHILERNEQLQNEKRINEHPKIEREELFDILYEITNEAMKCGFLTGFDFRPYQSPTHCKKFNEVVSYTEHFGWITEEDCCIMYSLTDKGRTVIRSAPDFEGKDDFDRIVDKVLINR